MIILAKMSAILRLFARVACVEAEFSCKVNDVYFDLKPVESSPELDSFMTCMKGKGFNISTWIFSHGDGDTVYKYVYDGYPCGSQFNNFTVLANALNNCNPNDTVPDTYMAYHIDNWEQLLWHVEVLREDSEPYENATKVDKSGEAHDSFDFQNNKVMAKRDKDLESSTFGKSLNLGFLMISPNEWTLVDNTIIEMFSF